MKKEKWHTKIYTMQQKVDLSEKFLAIQAYLKK